MKTYPPEHWKALGNWVGSARTQAGYSDTKAWAGAVGRSTRQVLGLERGEPVGPKTIEAVADALEVGSWALFGILDAGKASDSWSDARAKTLAERDRAAMEHPEPSIYVTDLDPDEARRPVTWGHMEDRFAEMEERIARLERSVLRIIDAHPKGGDGDAEEPRGPAPTSGLVDQSKLIVKQRRGEEPRATRSHDPQD